jgi:FtsH-binding integral membrane protein
MRPLIILLIGFGSLGLSFGLSRLLRKRSKKSALLPTLLFPLAWFIFCLVNVALGIRAGYPIVVALLVFALTFGLPTALAALTARRNKST